MLFALPLLGVASLVVAEPVDFTLKDVSGISHSLSDYRGKWVIVNYWATWCPPCLDEIPELIDVHERDNNTVVLGIDVERVDREYLKEFISSMFISYPVMPATTQEGILGPIIGLPTTYIISPTGEIVVRHTGPLTANMIQLFIEKKSAKKISSEGS